MTGPLVVSGAVVHRGSFTLEVSLRAEPGEVVGLVGPNGCGKTTALHAIAGLLPLSAGEILLAGEAYDAAAAWVAPQQRRSGLVPQTALLLGHLSALENVAFGARAQGVHRAEAREWAQDWLVRLGIEHLGPVRADRLSGGQAQAVAIARALAARPRVLLLDEPFSALDEQMRPHLRDRVLAEVERLHLPAVLVSHDRGEVDAVAARVVSL